MLPVSFFPNVQIFESFGAIELLQLPSDPETGHGKGYGFVQVNDWDMHC
jgi:hypothetical protein